MDPATSKIEFTLALPKIIFFVAAAAYFFYCAYDRAGYHFFDNVDLVIHEAGHVVFMLFGEFITAAGGTLLQLLVPAVFAAYFFLKDDKYSASIILFWLGQSFVNVARYAGDAVKMELPLLGGGEHDWNYLLGELDVLRYTDQISAGFYYTGVAIIIAGIIIGLLSLVKYREHTTYGQSL